MVSKKLKNNSKKAKLMLTYIFFYDIITALINLGIAQMVARYLGVVEAVGSNPATQTIKPLDFPTAFCFILIIRDLNSRSFVKPNTVY